MTLLTQQTGRYLLLLCALMALFTAIAHLSCIVLGEQCYRAQLAPRAIIESAIHGTLFAPLATVVIACIFIICALYALAGARAIVRLPLTRVAIYIIGSICILRGLATFPLLLSHPEMASTFAIIAGILWFLCGVGYLLGYKLMGYDEQL
ncbi:hypothetical protein CWB96_06495 [Pseudoalteromonas citrea]|uniref:Uncharacterized protein n=1 Tax=Pseudoalteromonas citrea TaxID=43655 RepID=A0A5S3XTB5_9GAMM|nr:hypothetical protein [Pseudoalteromonas citrea]TMP39805.1 hypothetical protein CWB97_20510 [Pseudoalteromonas citrea]TMP60528.1 hypothetical protein CWB96_06495 [Pseudoalteromonas citrea]